MFSMQRRTGHQVLQAAVCCCTAEVSNHLLSFSAPSGLRWITSARGGGSQEEELTVGTLSSLLVSRDDGSVHPFFAALSFEASRHGHRCHPRGHCPVLTGKSVAVRTHDAWWRRCTKGLGYDPVHYSATSRLWQGSCIQELLSAVRAGGALGCRVCCRGRIFTLLSWWWFSVLSRHKSRPLKSSPSAHPRKGISLALCFCMSALRGESAELNVLALKMYSLPRCTGSDTRDCGDLLVTHTVKAFA